MAWLRRLLHLRAKESLYNKRGLLSLHGPSQDGWTAVSSARSAPDTLAAPMPRGSRTGMGSGLIATRVPLTGKEPENESENEGWPWQGPSHDSWRY